MRTKGLKFGILLLVLGLPIALAAQESLGDLARQLREQREKSAKKPVKVYTNDNLPGRLPGEGPSASAGASTEAAKATPSSSAQSEQAGASEKAAEGQESEKAGSPEDKQKTKEYWQVKFKSLRAQVAGAQEEQKLCEDELNLLQIESARALVPSAKTDLEAKVKAKQDELDGKRAAVDKLKKQLEDLEKEFQGSGAPEDWSKTD
jgi:chromosome segregation ATPase